MGTGKASSLSKYSRSQQEDAPPPRKANGGSVVAGVDAVGRRPDVDARRPPPRLRLAGVSRTVRASHLVMAGAGGIGSGSIWDGGTSDGRRAGLSMADWAAGRPRSAAVAASSHHAGRRRCAAPDSMPRRPRERGELLAVKFVPSLSGFFL